MKMRILPFVAMATVPAMYAQVQTFDIATFIPPRGWSHTESNGALLLQDRKTVQGRVEFCQIYLFASRPSNANPAQNFQSEWQTKIGGNLRIDAQASPQTEQTPDGWTVLTAHADVVKQGVPMRALLATASGFGKLVSVVVTVSPNSYQAELGGFFRNLNFNGRGGGQPPPGQSSPPTGSALSGGIAGSLADYTYTPPDQWTRQESRDRIVLLSPAYGNGERCQVTILPMRPASRPLADDSISAFREMFKTDPLTSYPSPPPKLASGMSPQGWEYFTIRKLVGGQEGDGKGMGTILLLAKVGDQVATIVGTSKDFIVSNCFGELVRDVWPKFFYSLQFKNARPSGQEQAAIQQRLAGDWITATGSVGLRYTFLANGRYAGAGATQYRTRVSSTEVLQTTQAYFGDGAYSFDGNTIILAGDDQKRTTYFFRLQRVSKDSGRTWTDELCLLDPRNSGEVCYRKE